jgi:hypothetical protein
VLERCFPARDEAVIDPEIGGEKRALASLAKVFERAKLDFDLASFRHRRIGAVEWTICLYLASSPVMRYPKIPKLPAGPRMMDFARILTNSMMRKKSV